MSDEEQDSQLSHLAVAIEQFLQSATLGEYARRLRLLSTFERHVQADGLGTDRLEGRLDALPRRLD